MEQALQAAAEIGIPIINCGPGGKSGDEESLQQAIDDAGQPEPPGGEVWRDAVRQGARGAERLQHADHAAGHGRPSPRRRSASTWTRRTSTAPARTRSRPSPRSSPASSTCTSATARGGSRARASRRMQANGRGDIDLVGYIRVLHENGYTGPLDLEIIGAKEYTRGAVLRHRGRVARAHAGVPAGLRRAVVRGAGLDPAPGIGL